MLVSHFNFILVSRLLWLQCLFSSSYLPTLISLLKWIFCKSGESSSALMSSTHYWERIYSLFTTNYLRRMSLPSVVLSSSSVLCVKMDGIRGSQKSNPLRRTQGDSEPWLLFPGFGGGAWNDWGSSFYVYCFQDLLGCLFYFIIFYSWVFLYMGLIDYEKKMSTKNFNESPYQRGISYQDKINVEEL